MTDRTALYRLFDAAGELLYIGIAYHPSKRFAEHATSKAWWPQVARREVEWVDSRASAEIAERCAIAAERPRHNGVHNVGHPVTAEMSSESKVVLAQYKAHVDGERELKPEMRKRAAQELRKGTTVGQLAKATGLTPEVFRRMARDLGVEHKRPPTVGRLADQLKES